MTSTAALLLAIAGCWAVLAALLAGNGYLVLRALRVPRSPRDHAWAALWLGFAATLALLQAWHLLLPVGGAALAVLAATGALGLALERTALEGGLAAVRRAPGASLLAALAALWLADRALGPPVGDSLLYHLSAVRWSGAHAAVPGLANLNYRLGFNNASLLWTSLVDVGPWEGRGSHLAAGVLVLAWTLRAGAGLVRWRRGTATRADLFAAFLLAPLAGHAVTLGELRLSTSDPDTFCGLLVLASVERLLAATAPAPGAPPAARDLDLLLATALAAAAATAKPSMLPFAAAVPLAAVLHARHAGPPGAARRLAGRAAAALALLLVPWVGRGLVLSGYPLYPSSALPFPFDWAVPAGQLPLVRSYISQHFMPPVAQELAARSGSALGGWLWWQATRCPELILLPASLLAAGLAALRRPGRLDRPTRVVLAVLLPPLLLWATLAPAPRFAYGPAWAAAAAVAAAAAAGRARAGAGVLVALALALLPPLHRSAAWAAAGRADRVLETWVLVGGLQEPPPAPLRPVRVSASLSVLTPADGAPIGNAPLLATDEPQPGLELRRPGDLGAGFRIGPAR